MGTYTSDPLWQYTIPEILLHLEDRGYTRDHLVELFDNSWEMEHPLRCRILQYDAESNTMTPLSQSCPVHHAMMNGLADRLWEFKGPGRFALSPQMLEEILSTEPPAWVKEL